MEFNYDMDPVHLRTHEINYELRIRSIVPSKADIIQRRKCLRETLKTEIARPDLKYTTPDFDFNLEKTELDTSIRTLQELVDDFDGIREDVHKRFNSRYNHIKGRLLRLEESANQPEISEYKNDKIILVTSMAADVQEILDGARPRVQQSLPIPNSSIKAMPLFKWGITFDGSTESQSVNSFLQRVEELRIARNTTKEILYQSAVDLFTGQGLHWYRAIKSSVSDWDSLADALKRDFLPPDYDDELWHEIRHRTQGEEEKVTIFIATMENLFSRLSIKPDEQERLRIIKKNILPAFQVQIALLEISTISQLCEVCRKLENAQMALKKFQPPPKKSLATLEPDLAHSSTSVDRATVGKSNSSRQNQPRPAVPEMKCWSCNQVGHIRRDCRAKNRLVCHGCRKPGVIRPNCSCSKNVDRGNVL